MSTKPKNNRHKHTHVQLQRDYCHLPFQMNVKSTQTQAGFGWALLFSRVNFIPSSAGGASIPRSSRRRNWETLESHSQTSSVRHKNTDTDSRRDTGADGTFYRERRCLFTCDEERWRTQCRAKSLKSQAEKWLEAAASWVGCRAENWSTMSFNCVLTFEKDFMSLKIHIQQTNKMQFKPGSISLDYSIMDVSACVRYWFFNSGEVAHMVMYLLTSNTPTHTRTSSRNGRCKYRPALNTQQTVALSAGSASCPKVWLF